MHLHPRLTAIFITLITLTPLFVSCQDNDPSPTHHPKVEGTIAIIIHTDRGPIHASLYANQTPVTVANFLNLAAHGYYDNTRFHRVIPGFVAQGGDPTATGRGGPGYSFRDETRKDLQHDSAGILSMANSDNHHTKEPYSQPAPGTNGSQFFITLAATSHLDGYHTVFGQVTQGLDVVQSLTGKLQQPGWSSDGKGSLIKRIEILSTEAKEELFIEQAERIREWNIHLKNQQSP